MLAKSPLQKNSLWARSILLRRPFFMLVPTIRMAISRFVIKRCRCSTEGGGLTLYSRPKGKFPCGKKATTAYSSHAVVCRVKFKPISGYAPDDPNIRLMSHTDAIEVWLVSLPGTDMYVPYYLLLPTRFRA